METNPVAEKAAAELKKQEGYYFHNDLITAAVLEFQATGDRSTLIPHTKAFQDLVNGVINTHGVWRFWQDRAELESEGFQTILQCLERYDEKGGTSLFSYLSIAVKFRLRNWTRSENNRFILGVTADTASGGSARTDRYNDSDGMDAAERMSEQPRRVFLDRDWGNNYRARRICHIMERVLGGGDVNDERDVIRQTMKAAGASQGQVEWVINQVREHGSATLS